MRALLLPLQPRFIVYTAVLLVAALLLYELLIGFTSLDRRNPAGRLFDAWHRRHRRSVSDAGMRCCAIIRSRRISVSSWKKSARRSANIFSKAKRTARRSRATSARWSISAPSRRSTSGRSARRTTSMPAASNGCIIRSRRSSSAKEPFRITIGGPDCTKPYSASIFNISAMSFGALSANAIRALNSGAKKGNFAHDTGEGGFSPYHRENGGDIIWEIGSGYFSCRNADGTFCAEKFDRRRQERPGQDGRAQTQPGRQARPWRRAARRPRSARKSPPRAACRWASTASRRRAIRHSRRRSR